ncbi:eukaryotic translation initiation factor 4E1-like [Drosophila sulfurigaster albostrigata]|uniref:eukaryotic translation initiation factor 4E1-like n=1 Tax=Drosophila sulfurigaster albostrigata TaxID=89887 RepID=UPI002D218392|nr:eukaryotic translation initiation factor 4E1-like [Drosophila sulfurigaster albostrigata]
MKDFAELQTMFKSAVPNSESMMETGSGDDNPTLERKDASEADVAVAATDVAAATDAVTDKVEREERDVAICTQELSGPEPEECSNLLQDDGGAMLPEVLDKHPLQYVWTLWYLENDRTKTWEDMQNEITSFDTVEDFWNLYNHIKPPSEIKLGSDYSLFKKGIRPMWEDAANNNGGRWVIALNKILKDDLDKLWMDVLLCLIGEVFDRYDEICGAVVNIRGKSNKISIWTANGDNKEAVLEIGHKLRDALRLGPQNSLQYQLHKDAMTKQGSNVKTTFTL